ncbi:MAG TPA: Sir2 family NAD-dependent protein deacetylase [Candidatus Angelobacter sp.]
MKAMDEHIESVRGWIEHSRRIVALTGAGISTESGIPDFRGPKGLWTQNPKAEKLSDIRYYMADGEVRKLAWQHRISHPAWQAKPNAGHLALAILEQSGRLHALITQNIDGLHQRAGNSAGKVIEVHGTIYDVVCMACEFRGPMEPVLERVRAGEEDPPCTSCGGILKSATISFGQALVPEVIESAMRAAEEADLLLAIGTSLTVYPVADAVPRAKAAGARVVILNAEPTPLDRLADAVLRRPIGEVLPQLVRELTISRALQETRP